MAIPLAKALPLAERIREALVPFCEVGPLGPLIEIAGSIRRRRPFVGDIDIVALVKPEQHFAFLARVKQATTVVKEGPQVMILNLANGVQLDLWLAQPELREDMFSPAVPSNYGSLLLCRTGSIQHNIHLVEHAKRMGLRWNLHHGVFDGHGRNLASVTEHDIFRVLKLDYVEPEKRER